MIWQHLRKLLLRLILKREEDLGPLNVGKDKSMYSGKSPEVNLKVES